MKTGHSKISDLEARAKELESKNREVESKSRALGKSRCVLEGDCWKALVKATEHINARNRKIDKLVANFDGVSVTNR